MQLDRGGGTNVMYNLAKARRDPNSMRNGMTPICRIFIIPPTTTASMRVTDLILTFHPHNHLEKCLYRVPRAESMATSTFSSGKSSLPSHHTKLFIQERFFTIHQKSCPPPPNIPTYISEHLYVKLSRTYYCYYVFFTLYSLSYVICMR